MHRPLWLRHLNRKKHTLLWPKNVSISHRFPSLISLFLGRTTTVANVIAISAEEMGDLRKGSETKWITARQWSSPDTWPPFRGSWVVGSWEVRMNGRTDWGLDGLTYGSRNLPQKEACHNELWCHFEERTLHRFARARRCSVWFTTLEVRGSESIGVCNVCQSHLMLPRGS